MPIVRGEVRANGTDSTSLLTRPTTVLMRLHRDLRDPRVSTPASFHTYDSLSCFLMTRLPVGSTTHCTP